MKKGWKIVIWVLLAGVIAFLAIKPVLNKQTKQEGAPGGAARAKLTVSAEVIKPATMTQYTINTGNISPAEQVDLKFESNGKITDIFFNEGEYVEQGTLLARINQEPLKAQLNKLESQVKLASDRVYRQEELLKRDAVSQEAYQSVLTEYNKLQADIELVKAQIAQTELRAPFSGTIGLRQLSVGAFATQSTPIATLTQTSNLKIDFNVPESYSSEVKKGTPITFTLLDNMGIERSYNAEVYAVESSVNKETRTLGVRALYDNSKGELMPGRYVSVTIVRDQIDNAISIPSECVIPEMGLYYVYLYRDGRAVPEYITTGLRTADRVQVLEGLSIGDTLLTSGVMQMRRGMAVDIKITNND